MFDRRYGANVATIKAPLARFQRAMDARLAGEVAGVAEQSSASAEEVSASTEETSASTQEIAASAQELSNSAQELERLVAQFTLA